MVEDPRVHPDVVLSIGHSNRPIDEFVELLTLHGVQLLADVRKMPGSRANPQFGGAALEKSLQGVHIDYVHLPGLGGLRRGTKGSRQLAKRILSSLCRLHAEAPV